MLDQSDIQGKLGRMLNGPLLLTKRALVPFFKVTFPRESHSIVLCCCITVDDVQLSCYRILTSLYSLGTGKNIYVEK